MKKTAIIISIMVTLVVILSSCLNDDVNSSDLETSNMFKHLIASESNSVTSPSGQYILEMITATKDNVYSGSFCIKNEKDKSLLYECGDYYRLRDTTFILWGEDDTVWVYSGDLGTFYWENNNETWVKKSYAKNKNKIVVPQALRELRPNHFN